MAKPITVTVAEVMEKGSVSIMDAMKMIGCGKTVIYGMVKDGTLPALKVRSQKKIPVAAIEKYIKANLIQG